MVRIRVVRVMARTRVKANIKVKLGEGRHENEGWA